MCAQIQLSWGVNFLPSKKEIIVLLIAADVLSESLDTVNSDLTQLCPVCSALNQRVEGKFPSVIITQKIQDPHLENIFRAAS